MANHLKIVISTKSIRRRSARFGKWALRNLPYLSLFIFVVAPLWVMAALLSIHSGLFSFSFSSKTVSSAELNAFLTFVAGGLGTAATVYGALLTRQHNDRERWRQQLQAIIGSLQFIREANQLERSVGVFSSMVLLGHQHVAIRMLEPAWEKEDIDPATATWVIGQILSGEDESLERRRPSDDTMTEATVILLKHAKLGHLTSHESLHVFFPGHFLHAWETDYPIPFAAKVNLLASMAMALANRPYAWWKERWRTGDQYLPNPSWPIDVWIKCAKWEHDPIVRASANELLITFWEHYRHERDKYTLDKVKPEELPAEIRYAKAQLPPWPAPEHRP